MAKNFFFLFGFSIKVTMRIYGAVSIKKSVRIYHTSRQYLHHRYSDRSWMVWLWIRNANVFCFKFSLKNKWQPTATTFIEIKYIRKKDELRISQDLSHFYPEKPSSSEYIDVKKILNNIWTHNARWNFLS